MLSETHGNRPALAGLASPVFAVIFNMHDEHVVGEHVLLRRNGRERERGQDRLFGLVGCAKVIVSVNLMDDIALRWHCLRARLRRKHFSDDINRGEGNVVCVTQGHSVNNTFTLGCLRREGCACAALGNAIAEP